jgi:hypothetical protein
MSENCAMVEWTGRRKGTKPHHLIPKRSDGSVRKGDMSFCGMVGVGDTDWDVAENPENRACRRCVRFSQRYEHIKRRRGMR